jgi:signal transduction histidine kinase
MRLLYVSLRSFLLYSSLLVFIGIPISVFVVRAIVEREINDSLHTDKNQFINHLKKFETLEDLEVDMNVFDQIAYDVDIKPDSSFDSKEYYITTSHYDSLDQEVKPFRELISHVMIKDKPYKLILRRSLLENDDLVFAIGIVQTAVMVLLSVGFFLINRSLSKKLWKPFYLTLNRLKALEFDKGESFEYEITRIVEFDDLNNAVQQLTEKNKRVFKQQKEFIENASHELQTPLAIFHSKLDLLMQDKELNGTQASLIKDLIETTQRISKLNKNLLLLSKIENEQFPGREPLNVEVILFEQLENFKLLTEDSGITTTGTMQSCNTIMNRTLLEVLISNLLRNAYQHNIPNGIVTIILSENTLIISNTGKPLTTTVEKIFERFNKDISHTNSTGLGLAIVHKVCDLSGCAIRYSYSNDMHHFTVQFNL